MNTKRLYKLVKLIGYTKSEIKELHINNKITVNDKIVSLSSIVSNKDIIKIDGNIISWPSYKYYLYNKPVGIESVISNKINSYINNINVDTKVMVAGRLDKDSCGLMILSNDGDFINYIQTSPDIKKTYIIKLDKKITNEFLKGYNKEYIIRGRKTTKILYEIIDDYTLKLVLNEGVYRQIRTITKLNGNKVIDLKRIQIGEYKLDGIDIGNIKEIEI